MSIRPLSTSRLFHPSSLAWRGGPINRPAAHASRINRTLALARPTEVHATQGFINTYAGLEAATRRNLKTEKVVESIWEYAAHQLIVVRDNKERLISYGHIAKFLQEWKMDGEFAFTPSRAFSAGLATLVKEITRPKRVSDMLPSEMPPLAEWDEETPLATALAAKSKMGYAQLIVRRKGSNRLALVTNFGLAGWHMNRTKPLAESTVGDVLAFEDRDTWQAVSPTDLLDKVRDAFRAQVPDPSEPGRMRRKIWRVVITHNGKTDGIPRGILHPRDVAAIESRSFRLDEVETEGSHLLQSPEEKARAERFIEVYNRFENGLKAFLHSDKHMGSMLANAREVLPHLGKHYELLSELSWLRSEMVHNFVHKGIYDFTPSEKFLRFFEDLVSEILRPRTLNEAFGRAIHEYAETDSASTVLEIFRTKRYGQVVCRHSTSGELCLITHDAINELAGTGVDVREATLADVLRHERQGALRFFGPAETRTDAVYAFREIGDNGSPRYWAGLITDDGSPTGNLLGIVTPYDVNIHDG